MQVFEDEEQWPLRRQVLKVLRQGSEEETLLLFRLQGWKGREVGQAAGNLRQQASDSRRGSTKLAAQFCGRKGGQAIAQHLQQRCKGDRAVRLEALAFQRQPAFGYRLCLDFGQQPRLADACFARNQNDMSTPIAGLLDDPAKRIDILSTADKHGRHD